MPANYETIMKGFTKTITQCEARIKALVVAEEKQGQIIKTAIDKRDEHSNERLKTTKLLENLTKLLS
tara:strand:- start:275 stop:475 length:201 start_codon:yes stop_codon:yes gene_type:complete